MTCFDNTLTNTSTISVNIWSTKIITIDECWSYWKMCRCQDSLKEDILVVSISAIKYIILLAFTAIIMTSRERLKVVLIYEVWMNNVAADTYDLGFLPRMTQKYEVILFFASTHKGHEICKPYTQSVALSIQTYTHTSPKSIHMYTPHRRQWYTWI